MIRDLLHCAPVYLSRTALLVLALAVPACRESTPQVTKVEADKVVPGGTVALAGEAFGEEAPGVEVRVDDQMGRVTRVSSTSIEVELPRGLHAGRHELVVTNLKSGKSSAPYELKVTEVVSVPAGTKLAVRTVDSIGSATNSPGDTFLLTLEEPLLIRGALVADRGSRVVGRVTRAVGPGRVKGRAQIGFTLVELQPLGTTRTLPLITGEFDSMARKTHSRDALTIGIATGVGSLIGALAGGGKGAAIGAASGAAAGTGTVLLTKGEQVTIPAGASFHFDLVQELSFEIDEPLPQAAAARRSDPS